jgi:hypothetical protein
MSILLCFINVLDIFIPSTQQTIGCNGFLQRHVSTHTSRRQVMFRTFWFLSLLLLTVLEVVGQYEVVAILTLT